MELKIQNITKRYRDKTAVDDVSITLTPGVWGLLGANGAGKTTLMRMLAGILRPSSGRFCAMGLRLGRLVRPTGKSWGICRRNSGFTRNSRCRTIWNIWAALKGSAAHRGCPADRRTAGAGKPH